jgi:hypothetical protein
VGFDFLGAAENENLWKMDGWVMAHTIGIDGFKLSASYPNANYGSEQWKWGNTGEGSRYLNWIRLFHGYERNTAASEVDQDIDLILRARRRVTEQAKARWTAGTVNMALRPGLILELRHFYGMKDRELITALVTGATLHHRTRWPSNLAVRMEGAGGELTEVRGECIDWGAGTEKRFCPETAN